ncbi:cyclophilin-like fold protein [Paenibacillus sp. PvP052]|uniref:cyclophilin-like fold protein n=1 Tax=Paenibacillus sp. PvP052 TaxID=2817853 RepID=UPI0032AFC88E
MTVGETIITATLDHSKTSQDFIESLPQTISMKRWENREYYGAIQESLSDEGELQSVFENGDVAYWPSGKSLALFFDKSVDPTLSSPVIIIGKITSDLGVFESLGEAVEMKVEVKN